MKKIYPGRKCLTCNKISNKFIKISIHNCNEYFICNKCIKKNKLNKLKYYDLLKFAIDNDNEAITNINIFIKHCNEFFDKKWLHYEGKNIEEYYIARNIAKLNLKGKNIWDWM